MILLWTWLSGKIKYVLAGAGMALAAFLALNRYGATKKEEGASEALIEALKDDAVKREKASEAAFKEKRDVSGVSDSDLINRVRRRSDDFGSL